MTRPNSHHDEMLDLEKSPMTASSSTSDLPDSSPHHPDDTAASPTLTVEPPHDHHSNGGTIYRTNSNTYPTQLNEDEKAALQVFSSDQHPETEEELAEKDESGLNVPRERQSIGSALAKAVTNGFQRFSIVSGQQEEPSRVDDDPYGWNKPKPVGIPKSSYYTGPPGMDSAYGTDPVGVIGVHHPREILRIERDYSSGEIPQFHDIFPLELEGRITPTQFQETINDINEILISANDLSKSAVYNLVAAFTLYASMLVTTSPYEKEMARLEALIDHKNATIFQPQGLRILWPRKTAFLFLEIEYY